MTDLRNFRGFKRPASRSSNRAENSEPPLVTDGQTFKQTNTHAGWQYMKLRNCRTKPWRYMKLRNCRTKLILEPQIPWNLWICGSVDPAQISPIYSFARVIFQYIFRQDKSIYVSICASNCVSICAANCVSICISSSSLALGLYPSLLLSFLSSFSVFLSFYLYIYQFLSIYLPIC